MVVIKESRKRLKAEYGIDFVDRLAEFSEIIGYTLEDDPEEVRVEFNPDRPDLFSFASLGRAMKCFYDKNYWIPRDIDASGVQFSIESNVRKLRKYAVGFIARGNKISEKLANLIEYQERIHDNIGKSRSKVSIGLHDLDKIHAPFVYRAVDIHDVKFTTFDGLVSGSAELILKKHPKGQEFIHLIPSKDEVPVILDSEGEVLSMPPIVNGDKSKVEESTRNFFVDITGPDRKATRDAYFLLLYEFRNLGYSISSVHSVYEDMKDLELERYDKRRLHVSKDEFVKIAGISLSQENAIGILRKMGYVAEPSSAWIDVIVPGNRIDVMGPVDIIEDLVKGYGLSNISEKSMDLPLIGKPNLSSDFSSIIRDAMIGIGLQEVRTFVVSSSDHYRNFHYRGGLEVMNPKSLDYSVVRDRLHINILELLRINKRRPLPHKVFEIGEVYNNGEQETRFCAIVMDSRSSYSAIKQVLDYISRRLGIKDMEVRPNREEGFIEGRSGDIYLDGKLAGIIGEIDPEVLTGFDLSTPAGAIELDLEILMSLSE